MDRPKDNNIYQVVQTSETSVYFCLYFLNTLATSDNFGTLYQQFITNTVMNIYFYSLEGATKMKHFGPLFP